MIRSIRQYIEETQSAEGNIPRPPDNCCQCCGEEFGTGFFMARRAQGMPGICITCAEMMQHDVSDYDEGGV